MPQVRSAIQSEANTEAHAIRRQLLKLAKRIRRFRAAHPPQCECHWCDAVHAREIRQALAATAWAATETASALAELPPFRGRTVPNHMHPASITHQADEPAVVTG